MHIEILQLIEGAKKAKGLTVVIDVLRAFSVACYMTENGAERIYPVGDIEIAYQLKKQNPEFILVGERLEKKPKGFDFGNSPSQMGQFDLKQKTVVHTTSSGTQGISNATNADQIITGSFVNADAIARYVKRSQPDVLSLVCMGYASQYPTEEDTFCAEYIKQVLEGEQPDFKTMVETIKNTSGRRFFLPENQSHAPSIDFEMCTRLSIFDFVLKVEYDADKNLNYLKRIDV
jgi:2-phosphosulfolactate phosphatase